MGTPAPPPATDSPVSAVGVPAGGVRLADLGFEYGPVEAITVPAEVQIGLRVDQPNMVTVMFGAPAGEVIAAWLPYAA